MTIPAFLRRALLLFLLVCPAASGQTDSLRFVLRGSVQDGETGKPLSEVNVSLPGSNYATVTNAEGDFTIKSSFEPVSVTLSLLGYRTVTQTLSGTPAGALRIRMFKDALFLREAVLIGDPKTLLEKALEKIPENFPVVPERFRCFYRETVQKRQRFIYISEAVTDMYKTSYNEGVGRDRVLVAKSRLLISPKTSDTLGVKVVGGPAQGVLLDLVKNRDDLFGSEMLALYKLELGDPVMMNGRPQYLLRMIPHGEDEWALHHVKAFIDMETLSFTRLDCSLDISNEAKATKTMLVRKPLGVRFRPREMSLRVDYAYDGSLSRISYVRTRFRFNCDWRKKLFRTAFTAVNEMVVTDRCAGEARPIDRRESFRSNATLFDTAQYYSDPDFWKDYNIIEPTTSLEHAIDRLKK